MNPRIGDLVTVDRDGFIKKARKNSRRLLGLVIDEKDTPNYYTVVKMQTRDKTEYWVATSGYLPTFATVAVA